MIHMVILLALFTAKINYVESLQLVERDVKDLCLDTLGMVEMGFKQDYVIDAMEKVFDKKYQYDHPDVALTLAERALLRSLIDLLTQIKLGTRSRPSSSSVESSKTSSSFSSPSSSSSSGRGSYYNGHGNVMNNPGYDNKVTIELKNDQMGSGSLFMGADTWSTGFGDARSRIPILATNSLNKIYNSDTTNAYLFTNDGTTTRQDNREGPALIEIRKDDDEFDSPPMWRGSSKEVASKTHSAITKSSAVKQTCNSISFPASLDSGNYSQWAASIQQLQSQISA